jgi:hypothetical protein
MHVKLADFLKAGRAMQACMLHEAVGSICQAAGTSFWAPVMMRSIRLLVQIASYVFLVRAYRFILLRLGSFQ